MGTDFTEIEGMEHLAELEFLGPEFLTWLWWRSDAGGGLFTVPGVGDVSIQFVKLLRLESGTQPNLEMVQCLGRAAQEMKEAKMGLLLGKKVARARLEIRMESTTVEVTVSGKTMDFHSVKIVDRFQNRNSGEGMLEGDVDQQDSATLIFLKLKAIKEVRLIVHSIFEQFMMKRLEPSLWMQEKMAMREWIR